MLSQEAGTRVTRHIYPRQQNQDPQLYSLRESS
jgi:hypothetical protein